MASGEAGAKETKQSVKIHGLGIMDKRILSRGRTKPASLARENSELSPHPLPPLGEARKTIGDRLGRDFLF